MMSSATKSLAAVIAEKKEVLESCHVLKGHQERQAVVSLGFEGVRVTVRRKDRCIVNGAWGFLAGGKLGCIIGPSGSGKTTVVNVLAGRVRDGRILAVEGEVVLGGRAVDPALPAVRNAMGYVDQSDETLVAMSTPREALRFAAALRLPGTAAAREEMVEGVILALGLEACADEFIGNVRRRGISGGEKRRTSIGIELLNRPGLLFMDEATSGLDSASANSVIAVLKVLAEGAGTTVLSTLHQPTSAILFVHSTVVLLSNRGQTAYCGPTDLLAAHLEARNIEVPPYYNPADVALDAVADVEIDDPFLQAKPKQGLHRLIEDASSAAATVETKAQEEPPTTTTTTTTTTAAAAAAAPSAGRADEEAPPSPLVMKGSGGVREAAAEGRKKKKAPREEAAAPPYKASWDRQLALLSARRFREMRRERSTYVIRFSIAIVMASLYGVLFYNAGGRNDERPQNMQTHYGALTFLVIAAQMGASQVTLTRIPYERPVFLREYRTGMYDYWTYYVVQTTAEMPVALLEEVVKNTIAYNLFNLDGDFTILCLITFLLSIAIASLASMLTATTNSVASAQALLPVVLVPQMLFAGFFVRIEQIPLVLRWARWLCTLRYALSAALLNEFNCGSNRTCSTMMRDNKIHELTLLENICVLLAMTPAFQIIGAFELKRSADPAS